MKDRVPVGGRVLWIRSMRIGSIPVIRVEKCQKEMKDLSAERKLTTSQKKPQNAPPQE